MRLLPSKDKSKESFPVVKNGKTLNVLNSNRNLIPKIFTTDSRHPRVLCITNEIQFDTRRF